MWRALRSRDFRLLWLGQSASLVGDALIVVAVGLFVTRLTHDSSAVGLVLTAYTVPLILFLLLGGVIGDKLSRRRVMLVCDAVRGTLHGLLAVLIATHTVQVWHMVVIGVAFGTAEAFFRPAYVGLVPQTVPVEHVQSAQALGSLSREVATFASPALATLLVLGGGPAVAFGVDAATFLVSALLLLRVRGGSRGGATTASTMRADLAQGWRAVRSRPWVWATIAAFSIGQLLALAPFLVLGAHIAQRLYGSDAIYGLASTFWGAGTVSGALLAGRWRPRLPMRAALAVAAPWPGCVTVFALGAPVATVCVAMGVAGLGVGLFAVWWDTVLAELIPPHLLSRVAAWEWLGMTAVLPIGYLLVGPLTAWLGDTRLLIGGGLVGVSAAALALLPATTRALTWPAAPASSPVAASRADGTSVTPSTMTADTAPANGA
jgi:MFS family permease